MSERKKNKSERWDIDLHGFINHMSSGNNNKLVALLLSIIRSGYLLQVDVFVVPSYY